MKKHAGQQKRDEEHFSSRLRKVIDVIVTLLREYEEAASKADAGDGKPDLAVLQSFDLALQLLGDIQSVLKAQDILESGTQDDLKALGNSLSLAQSREILFPHFFPSSIGKKSMMENIQIF